MAEVADSGLWKHGKPNLPHEWVCTETDPRHHHAFGLCCSAMCWCNMEPVIVRGLHTGGQWLHDPHPECDRADWHRFEECGIKQKRAGRAINTVSAYLGVGTKKKGRR